MSDYERAAERIDALDGDPVRLDVLDLSRRDPLPPRHVIEQWLPEGQVTLFAGHGGCGKSLIALTVAVCVALGLPLFGLHCARRRVLLLSYEDGADVLHWRLRRVCDMLGADMATLDGWLTLYDATGTGAPLYVETRGEHGTTAAYQWLRERMAEHGAQVLILDGSADAYAGNENVRAQVRAFVLRLRRLLPADGAALLIHHVDAASAHGGSTKGYSGSTAWHNSCRARWLLRRDGEAEDADPSRLLLQLHKANHGKPGASIALRFNDVAGCFVPECAPTASPLDRAMREIDEREAVLTLIRAADLAGNPIPAATGGTRTAYSVAQVRPDFPASLRGKTGRARFFDHLEALRQAGAVRVADQRYGARNSREVLHAT